MRGPMFEQISVVYETNLMGQKEEANGTVDLRLTERRSEKMGPRKTLN